ncbi:MAG: UbiA prenyltransferase [Thermoleophilia bacterium]|nr:UbiA prenyltransferase [Thermoleophilia bacterium]
MNVTDSHVKDAATSTEDATTGDAQDTRGSVARVFAFLIERFPPAPQLILMAVLFVAATLMSAVLLPGSLTGALGDIDVAKAIAGFVGSLLFIVRLRVYDDVKDADADRIENPTRPIPRGLVSIRELDVTGVVILLVEAALIASVGTLTFVVWAIAAAWSVLMRVEFFVSEWLDRHPATFAISHMVVLGLIYGALLAMGIDARGGDTSVSELLTEPLALYAMLAATSIGIGFEWGRKFERYYAPHGERAWSLWILWPSLGAIGFTALVRDTYPTWSLLALVVVTVGTILGHALVMTQRDRSGSVVPTGNLREAVEAVPGAAGLLVYLVLASAGVTELIA